MKLLHVGLHNKINQNAGDTVLFHATRQCFKHFLGPIDWTLHQAWEPFDASVANDHDGVVVGGGGMLLPDQDGAAYEASGWQWNCTLDELDAIKVPLIVFGIGYNRFRGQEGFNHLFADHIAATVRKAAFFGMREKGGVKALGLQGIWYQPCPTTCIWDLYPESQEPIDAGFGKPVLALNLATDRVHLRHASGEDRLRAYAGIVGLAKQVIDGGYQPLIYCHKPDDGELADLFDLHKIWPISRHLWDFDAEEIIAAYRCVDTAIGMRGHAQLIPFGMHKKIASIISHDKLKWFLEDIGRPELGVEVKDYADIPRIRSGKCVGEQQDLWRITSQNMAMIGKILGMPM